MRGAVLPAAADPAARVAAAVSRAALGLVLGVGVALFAAVSWKMVTWPHEVIVTEGAIGLAVRSILDGTGLYAPQRWSEAPYVIVHYTPLYYLATAAWTWLTGAGLFGGRVISVAATTGTALLAAWIVRRETGRTGPALLAAGLWLSFYQVVFWGTTQRVDALGTLLEGAGILAYLRARRRGGVGWSALPWWIAAWTTKQVMIVALTAATLDLLLGDWRERPGARRSGAGLAALVRGRGVRFGAAGFGALVLLFVLMVAATGGGFWTAAVLGTVSADADPPWVIFSNSELFFGSPWNMATFMIASALAAFALAGRLPGQAGRGEPMGFTAAPGRLPGWTPWPFLGLYLWLGLAVAIATDANLPRFFPPMLAMALIIPAGLAGLRPQPALAAALASALAFTGVFHTVYEMRSLVRERILTLDADCERLRLAEAAARHADGGPVLAQDVGMLLSADLPVTVADPYVFSILTGNDAWQPARRLGPGVRDGRYRAIILNRPLEEMNDWEWTTLWISPTRHDIAERYRLAETVTVESTWRFLEPTRYIYVPRKPAGGETAGDVGTAGD